MPVIRVKTQNEALGEAGFWLFALLFAFVALGMLALGWIHNGLLPTAGWVHFLAAIGAIAATVTAAVGFCVLLIARVARSFVRAFRTGK